jgi:hypothetical protein
MGRREEHGAKGSMVLRRDWSESSSGHVETTNDLHLEATADGKAVTLTVSKGTTNFYNNQQSTLRETRTVIAVDSLVALILANGRSVTE